MKRKHTAICLILLMATLRPFSSSAQDDEEWTRRADSITAGCKTSYDKAKAIYTWEALNLKYDYSYKIHSAKNCWRLRKGVCQAMSELFVVLASHCGLNAWVISGQARNHEYPDGDGPHAWVAAKTEKGTILIDPTWAVEPWDEEETNSKSFLRWFDVKPECMIFAHFPDDPKDQFLATPVTEAQYRALPNLEPTLVKAGLSAPGALAYFLKHPNERAPGVYNQGTPLNDVQLLQIPYGRKLYIGKTYTFKIKALNSKIKIDSNYGNWTKDGSTYTMVFRPNKEGRLNIQNNGGTMFYYEVVKP
jgi:hypothetical protein